MRKSMDGFPEAVLELLHERGVSQKELADAIQVTRQHLNAVLKVRVSPGRVLQQKVADFFGLSLSELLRGPAAGAPAMREPLAEYAPAAARPAPPEFIPIPYLEAEAAGSPGGSLVTGRGVRSFLAFNSQWIHAKGNPANMVVVRVMGQSMSNLAPDGAVVLVDESRSQFVDRKIFIVNHDNELKIKRLTRENNSFVLLSEDGITPPETVRKSAPFSILGRVVWVGYEID